MLADAVRDTLPFLRAEAEALMVDTCTITFGEGVTVFDEETLEDEEVSGPEIRYVGRCKVTSLGTGAANVATLHEVIGRYWLDLPHDAAVIPVGASVVVSSTDAALTDQKLTVAALVPGTHRVRRRLIVEDPQIAEDS